MSDPQHSLFGGDIDRGTFLDDLGGDAGGDETMVQIDDVPPVMTMPETIEEDSDTRDGVIVRYTGLVTASDNSGEAPEIICEPKSGSIFKVGETLVKCTAMDSSGNYTVGEFLIIVTGTPEDRGGLLPEIVTSP